MPKISISWGVSPEPGTPATTYDFATEAELAAFRLGITESEGWMEWHEVEEGYVHALCRSCEEGFDAKDLVNEQCAECRPVEPEGCRTDGCEEDPDTGDGWNGFCGNCADRREAASDSADDKADAAATVSEDARCAVGIHSWIDAVGKLAPDTQCTRCPETYGSPD